jgi:SAM-dependent methyltransferase
VSFNRLAPHYLWLETLAFGNQLQRARVACLPHIPTPHRALVVGEGNGRFLCELLRTYPNTRIDCVDESSVMLDLAQRRFKPEREAAREQVRFINASIENVPLENTRYDLVVTHFFFDCFTKPELLAIIPKLAASATASASWLIADFRIPPAGMRHYWARTVVAAMYRFFRLTTHITANSLVDPAPFLTANNFRRSEHKLFAGAIVYSDLWTRGGRSSATP